MPRSDAEHFRKRAVVLLAELTGKDTLDHRLTELVECIEAAAVAVVRKEMPRGCQCGPST